MYDIGALSGMTSGLSGNFGTYRGYAADNHAKLYQNLASRLGEDAAVKYTGVSKAEAAAAFSERGSTGATGSAADARNFVQSYSKQMTALKSAASDLLNAGSSALSASSSNAKVLEGSIAYKSAASGTYQFDVAQLAQQQVNTSQQYEASGANTIAGGGELQIQSGKGETLIDLSKYAGAATNAEAMSALAEDINKAGLGVSAQAVMKDGKVSLSLTAAETGAANGFQANGVFAVSSGLSNASQAAQDAVYQVDGKSYTSSSNKVQLDMFKVDVTLKGTGSASLTVGADAGQTADKVSKLLDTYNKSLTFLNDNYQKGSGVIRQMSNMLHLPVSEKSLNSIGINVAKDGTMSLDREKFLGAMSENPDSTREIVNGSYSLAQGLMNDANQGSAISSAKLTDGIRQEVSQEQAAIRSQFGGYSYGYSSYAMLLNYKSMGTLLNTLI